MTSGDAPAVVGSGAWSVFTRELGRSMSALRSDPRLLVTVFGYAFAIDGFTALGRVASGGATVVFGLTAAGLYIGLVGLRGAERIWFVHAAEGKRIAWSDVRALTVRYWRPFVALGGICLVPLVAAYFIGLMVSGGAHPSPIWGPIVLVPLDVALTFVTPALVFGPAMGRASTSVEDTSAWESVRAGLRVLRAQWPQCAWFALAPPLALSTWAIFVPTTEPMTRLVVAVIAAALSLVTTGAAAFYYLDHRPPRIVRYRGLRGAPRWFSDPSGLHARRYWDGRRWSDFAQDGGVIVLDPLDYSGARISSASGWQPDPGGLHDLRYWDGQKWSDFAQDGGVVTLDPM